MGGDFASGMFCALIGAFTSRKLQDFIYRSKGLQNIVLHIARDNVIIYYRNTVYGGDYYENKNNQCEYCKA